MKVLRKSDRIKVKIDGLEFVIAPLSYRDRIALSAQVKHSSGEAVVNFVEQTFIMIKKCVKSIKGLKDHNDEDYGLVFEDGTDSSDLTDECTEELLNTFQSGKEITALVQSSRGDLSEAEGMEFSLLGKS